MTLKLGIILWTLHLCRHYFILFWMILLKNAIGRKFHHNYSQSEATNQRYRCKDGCSPNNARQGERWPLASSTQGCCLPDRPASDDCCVCPLWRTQLGSGKVCSSNSSSRTSRTSSSSSSSSSSDKTRPGKTTHVFPAILWRYPGDTLKWKKRTPRHQSPSSFQHNHISKFQKGKTQHNPIPNGTDTLGKFQTCKNAGKSINNQNHVFQTQAGRRTHRLPQFFPPN